MKFWKRGACAALCLTLAAGLFAGCGQKTEDPENPVSTRSGNNGGSTEEEYVYVADFIPVRGELTSALRNGTYANGSLYYATNGKIGDNTPEGVTPEWPQKYWVYGTVLYKVGLDGSCEQIPYENRLAEVEEGVESGQYLSGMKVAPDGTIWLLERSYRSWNDAPEGVTEEDEDYWSYNHYEESYVLTAIGADGTVLRTLALEDFGNKPEDMPEDGYYYSNVDGFEIDGGGSLYLVVNESIELPDDYREGYTIYVLDGDGELQFTIPLDSHYVQNIFRRGDGGISVAYYDWENAGGQVVAEIDPETRTFGEPQRVSGDLYSMSTGGGDYDFYYTSGVNFYGYDLESGEKTKILNWLNCDVDTRYGDQTAIVLDDGRIVSVNSEWNDDGTVTNELILLTKTPSSQVPHKEIITLATQYLDWGVRSQIVDFNKNSDKYRIEVLDYSEYNTEEDYSAGLTKLKTEILSGSVPDILDLNGMPVGQFIARGLLEDLYPYIDGDSEINRADLMENVLDAFTRDGKLYQTLSSFYVFTVAGASSVVGDKPGWTVDQFRKALAEMRANNPNCVAFGPEVTRDDMLQYCLYLDMDSFVNWSTGECNFDSDGFVQLLEFVNSFPSEYEWDEGHVWTDEDNEDYRILTGSQMLRPVVFSDFYDAQWQLGAFNGQPVTYVGFPTAYGTGNMFGTDGSSYAMTGKCANKEAAWEFLRGFFTGADEDYYYGLSINRKAFEASLKEAMTPEYERDGDGNYILDEDGNRIEVDRGSIWITEDIQIPYHTMTQAEADQLMELINTTTKTLNIDEELNEIVSEGAAPYFAGQRSAAEVAKLIQSKAMLYVNEKR